MYQLNLARWTTLLRLSGPSDCVPVALSLVESMSFDAVKARCKFYSPYTTGYAVSVIGWVRGRTVRRVDHRPAHGYAYYAATAEQPAHVAPVLNGHVFDLPGYVNRRAEYFV